MNKSLSQITVAFILGDGYSGSTLLDLLLGSHTQMAGMGEIDAEAFDVFLEQNQLCTCLMHAGECHFWNKVLRRLQEDTGTSPFRLGSDGDVSETVTRQTLELLRAIKEVSGADVLIDSSKKFERAYTLAKSDAIMPKVIHLVRDGRAVAYSYTKRGKPFREAVLQWLTVNDQINSWLASDEAPEHMRVDYERLCAQPEEVVREVCDFLEVEWEPQMMSYGRKVHHNVRGNTMRFRIKNSTIALDETWKEKLSEDELRLFEELSASSEMVGTHSFVGVI